MPISEADVKVAVITGLAIGIAALAINVAAKRIEVKR